MAVDGRKKRSDSDSSSDSGSAAGPPAKKPRTEAPATQRPATAAPNAHSDAYADHVVNTAARSPLSASQLADVRQGVVHAVERSQGDLVDRQTADAIRSTLTDALDRSPTFRAAVAFGMRNHVEDLDDLTYRNRYEPNLETFDPRTPVDIRSLTVDALQRGDAAHMPIVPVNEAGRSEDYDESRPAHVSITPATNANSPYMDPWRQMLTHEIMHHVTGAGDPHGSAENVHGPTEILSRRVAAEMGWSIPDSRGYGDLTRRANIEEANRAALIDAAQRHPGPEHEFFERLDALSRPGPVSGVLHEPGSASPNGTGAEHSLGEFPSELDQIELPELFGLFADSAPAGAPTGFQNASAASRASWATQGRFFRYGQPVNGNAHARAFGFPDGSKVVVSAHEPMLADSDGLKFGRFLTVATTTAVGGLSGFMAGGPAGAIAGAAVAAGPGYALASSYGYDRIWQGFTLDYYNKGSAKPFYSQYMYAWDGDPKRVAKLSAIRDPKNVADYANFDPDKNWNWWKWNVGDAPLRHGK
jgi:hypothetical protein